MHLKEVSAQPENRILSRIRDSLGPQSPVGEDVLCVVAASDFANCDHEPGCAAISLESAVLRNEWIYKFAVGRSRRVAQ